MSFKKLIKWSETNFKELPWRKDRSLYRTWISEVMLQQTTVFTVKSRLDDFCKKFPDITSLAKASEEELLIQWKGLGYYQRAKNLKKAAIYLAENFEGDFPESIEDLMSVPGIGPYTASAIFAIGMNKKSLPVDANLERVLARIYGIDSEKGEKLKKVLREKFLKKEILNINTKNFRGLSEALMDLGREVCQSKRVFCELCQVRDICVAKGWDDPTKTPAVAPKNKIDKHRLPLIRVICEKGKKIYCYRKPKGTWLSGQYELPTFILNESDQHLNQYPLIKDKKLPHLMIKTGITKYKIENYIKRLSPKEMSTLGDFELLDIDVAMEKLSSASLKCIKEERKSKPDPV